MKYTNRDNEDFRGKRILLVGQPQKPPVTTIRTPIALLDLAQYYRKYASATVDCVSMTHLPDGEYDYVGYSVLCENEEIEAEVRFLSRMYPSSRIIVGGKWATDPGIPIEAPDNVAFFKGPGELLATDEIDYDEYPGWNSDDLCSPGFGIGHLGIMTTRGCPYNCHFCHNTEKKVQKFSVERTVHNIKMGFERLGVPAIFFNDDIFTSNAERMYEIISACADAKVDLRGKSKFFTHVNFVKDPVVAMIRVYQPWRVEIGIESGNTDQLKRMGKTFTAEKAYAAVERLLENGVPLSVLILIGFPGETVESLEDTLRFVDRFRKRIDYIGVSYYQPVRNTVGWEMCKVRLGRDPKVGTRTHNVTYVDPGLTAETLVKYHHRIRHGA